MIQLDLTQPIKEMHSKAFKSKLSEVSTTRHGTALHEQRPQRDPIYWVAASLQNRFLA